MLQVWYQFGEWTGVTTSANRERLLSHPAIVSFLPEQEEELKKMQKRAERFGMNVAPSLTQVEDNEKKQKRRERFGLATTDLGMEVRRYSLRQSSSLLSTS